MLRWYFAMAKYSYDVCSVMPGMFTQLCMQNWCKHKCRGSNSTHHLMGARHAWMHLNRYPTNCVSEKNSLWLIDAIWRHRSGSTSVHVMACCLTASSRSWNNVDLRYWSSVALTLGQFRGACQDTVLHSECENRTVEIIATFPRVNVLNLDVWYAWIIFQRTTRPSSCKYIQRLVYIGCISIFRQIYLSTG